MARKNRTDEQLLDSGYLADVTLICRGKELKAHRIILCTRNIWFRKCLDGGFEESRTGVVTIEEFEPRFVDWIVRRIYNPDLSFERLESRDESESKFEKYLELLRAADYFGVHDIDTKIASLFIRIVGPWFKPGRPLECPAETLLQITAAFQAVYKHHPPPEFSKPARLLLVEYAFMSRHYLYHKPEFISLLKQFPLLALDLFQTSLEFNDWRCDQEPFTARPGCGHCEEDSFCIELAPTSWKVARISVDRWCSNCSDDPEITGQGALWTGSTEI